MRARRRAALLVRFPWSEFICWRRPLGSLLRWHPRNQICWGRRRCRQRRPPHDPGAEGLVGPSDPARTPALWASPQQRACSVRVGQPARRGLALLVRCRWVCPGGSAAGCHRTEATRPGPPGSALTTVPCIAVAVFASPAARAACARGTWSRVRRCWHRARRARACPLLRCVPSSWTGRLAPSSTVRPLRRAREMHGARCGAARSSQPPGELKGGPRGPKPQRARASNRGRGQHGVGVA